MTSLRAKEETQNRKCSKRKCLSCALFLPSCQRKSSIERMPNNSSQQARVTLYSGTSIQRSAKGLGN